MQTNVNFRLYLGSNDDFPQDSYLGHYTYSLQSLKLGCNRPIIIKNTLREDREPE